MSNWSSERFRQASAVFDAALDLAPEEQWSFVDRMCADDRVLRDDVVGLLRAHHSAGAFLVTPAAEIAAPLLIEMGILAGPSPLPTHIGAFRVVRELGRGGMGRVYLGERDDGQFEHRVAIKLLPADVDSEITIGRFRTERQILAMLQHPHIARLLDGGVTEDGRPYLVMEYVDGIPIDVYCRQRALSIRDRLELFLVVTDAVEYAHRNLVVHRDLKPKNIFVAQDGSVKLLDFGLAKLLSGSDSLEGASTRAGHRWMTPQYAAPEQVRGMAVTTLTDVYQLGVVLYELLSGATPFAAHISSAYDLETAVLQREPKTLGGELRGDLNAIVMRALRKEPERRYASVRELAEDIRRHLAGHPVLARRHTAGYVARRFVRRNRAALATAAAGVLLLALYMFETVRQRNEARSQRDRALYEEQRASASSAFLQTLLTTIAPAGEQLRTVDLLDRARALLEKDYAADPRFVARMLMDLSEHYAAASDGAAIRAVLTRAGELARKSGDADVLAEAQCRFAQSNDATENLASVRVAVDHANQTLASMRNAAPRTRIQCMVAEARILDLEKKPDSAIAVLQRAISVATATGDTTSVEYVNLLGESASLTLQNRRYESLALTRRRIDALRRIGRSSSLMAIRARVNEGNLLLALGEMLAADSVFTALLPIASAVDSNYMETYVAMPLAGLAELFERPDSAAKIYRRAMKLAEQRGERSRYLWALGRLAATEAVSGDLSTAHRHLRELDASGQTSRLASLTPARIAEAENRPGEALQLYQRAMATMVPTGRVVAGWHRAPTQAARAALAAGDAATADSLANHALRLAHELGHDDARSADVGLALFIRARARLAIGDSVLARELADKAVPGLAHGLGPDHRASREAVALVATLRSP